LAAPAFYRFKVGELEATIVSDGPLPLGDASSVFKGATKPEIDKLLTENFASPDKFVAEQNALVVNNGERLVLIDTGVGSVTTFGPNTGRLLSNLRQSGIDPKDIDAVVITHAHVDHLGGLMAGGTRAFPNAQIYMTQVDFDFWTDEGKLGSPLKDFIQIARDSLLPNRDRIVFVKADQEFLPGMHMLSTPGHTVGHFSVVVSSGGQSLCNVADVVHHNVLAPQRPRVQFAFDTDPEQAVASRLRLFDMLATDRVPLLAYHFPWPGLGHLARSADAFRYVPMQLSTVL
jgi:glyoxylase-like metal-dependent hydrolase (beta-lactamase superfamily II)